MGAPSTVGGQAGGRAGERPRILPERRSVRTASSSSLMNKAIAPLIFFARERVAVTWEALQRRSRHVPSQFRRGEQKGAAYSSRESGGQSATYCISSEPLSGTALPAAICQRFVSLRTNTCRLHFLSAERRFSTLRDSQSLCAKPIRQAGPLTERPSAHYQRPSRRVAAFGNPVFLRYVSID